MLSTKTKVIVGLLSIDCLLTPAIKNYPNKEREKHDMSKPLLMTKLKNEVMKQKPGMEYYLKNININKVKKGCSGFIKNPDNNVIVYVTTDENTVGPEAYMCRYADSTTDYRGYRNIWANGLDQLVTQICNMLDKPIEQADKKRI